MNDIVVIALFCVMIFFASGLAAIKEWVIEKQNQRKKYEKRNNRKA